MLNVVAFLVVCSSFSYVVAVDRTDCKNNCPLGLIKYSESESESSIVSSRSSSR